MTFYDKLFPIAWLFVFMLVQAMYQKQYFLAGELAGRKWHFWQAALYGVAMTVVIPFAIYFGWWGGVKLALIGILERLAIYDPLLNILRKKRPILTYNGNGTTGSVQDNLENKLSPKWLLPLKIFYIIAFICSVIFIK
jgi:hypothetical protein